MARSDTSDLSNPADGAADAGAAYSKALLDLLGDDDPIEVLRVTRPRIESRLEGVSPLNLLVPESEGKWSALEVVHHLADSEIAWAWRLRQVLTQDGPRLMPYDQDAWADRLDYRRERIEDSLDLFRVNRRANLRLLERIEDSDLERVGDHAERGAQSLRVMIAIQAGHDLAHLRQLDRVLDAAARRP